MVACVFNMFRSEALVYYSRTSGGNWNSATTWSTTGYGQTTNSGTFPKSGDYAYIGDGYTIIVNTNCTTSYVIVGQGTSGELEYNAGGSYSLVVVNNVTVNSGAIIKYTGNSSRTHTLQIGNNLINNGDLDFYSDNDDVVNLVFYRPANSIVSGSGTQDLNKVTLLKSGSTAYYSEIQSTSFEAAIRELIITYGTYIHNNSSSFEVNSGAGSGLNIPADGVVKVTQGTLHLSPTQDDVTLSGTIIVSGGTLKIGSTAGLGGLRYDKNTSFVPKLEIQNGEMIVYGSIIYKSGSSSSSLNFSIAGGSLLLNSGSTGSGTSCFYVNDVAGSVCTFQDGSIILEKPNTTGTSITDLQLCGANGTVVSTGGFIQFGNANSGSNLIYTFTPQSALTFPNVLISGPSSNTATLCPSANSSDNINLTSLFITEGKTFDMRSVSGTTGDTRTLKLTGNYDGINSLFCDGTFLARSSTILLEGGEGQQLSGSGSFNLFNFTINNGTGMTLGQSLSISGTLNLSDGIIYSSPAYNLTVQTSGIIINGSSSSYVDGPLIREISTSTLTTLEFPIGKDGFYRPIDLGITHADASTVAYTAELLNANPRDLNFSLPGSIDKISGVRYYSITRSGAGNLVSLTHTIYYDADDGVDDPNNLRIVGDAGASSWLDLGGTGSGTSSGSITSASVSNLNGILALGNANGGTNPLPVSWLYFKAAKQDQLILLEWATASEVNTDYFELQSSYDGIHFSAIKRLSAAGNSTDMKIYSCFDAVSQRILIYYKVKQVDLNGDFSYSPTRVIHTLPTQTLIFPNPPIDNVFNISLSSEFDREVLVTVMDQNGRILNEAKVKSVSGVFEMRISGDQQKESLLVKVTDPGGKQWVGRILR